MVTNFNIEGLSHSVAEQIRLICQRNLGITKLVVTEQTGAKSANEQAFSVADSSFAAIWANPVVPLQQDHPSSKPIEPDSADTTLHHLGAASPVLAELFDQYENSQTPGQTEESNDRTISESALVPVHFERSPVTSEYGGSADLLHEWQSSETALDIKVSEAIIDGSVTDEGVYDTWSDGPLTYFNVYLDEMPTYVGRPFDNPGFNLSKGMIGAGLLSAVAVSGLLIGDTFSKPNPPETPSADNSQVEQDSADSLTELPVAAAAPERTQPELSPKAKEPEAASKPIAKNLKQPTSTPTQRISNQLLSIPSLPPPPLVSLNQPFALPSKPAPAATTPKPSNLPPLIPTPSQPAPAIATPEVFPPAASTTPKAPTQPPASNPAMTPEVVPQATVSPATEPQPLSRELPRSPQTSQAIPSLAPVLVTPPTSSTETKTSRSTPKESAEASKTAPTISHNSPTERKSQSGTTTQGTATPAAKTNTPQGIQDYLALGQAKSLQPLTLMPLSSQAATEAANTDKIGSFTVKQVDAQAYQQEWQNSNPKTNDPAIALAFPAYGFIDYQRQLIVLLQNDDKQAGIN